MQQAKIEREYPPEFLEFIPLFPGDIPKPTIYEQISQEALHLVFVIWKVEESRQMFLRQDASADMDHMVWHFMGKHDPSVCAQHHAFKDNLAKIVAAEQLKVKHLSAMLDLSFRSQFSEYDSQVEFSVCRDDQNVLHVFSVPALPPDPFGGSPLSFEDFVSMAMGGGYGGMPGFGDWGD